MKLKLMIHNPYFISITALGISSTVTQLIILREVLSLFEGNELIIGLVLGNWLLLTGLGAHFGKRSQHLKSPALFLLLAQFVIAVLPVITVTVLRVFKPLLFPPGAPPGLMGIFLTLFIFMTPYCLLSGFLHPLACVLFSEPDKKRSIGEVYLLDVVGDIAGGIMFSFILVFLFNSMTNTLIILCLNVFASFYLIIKSNILKGKQTFIALLSLFLLSGAGYVHFFSDLNLQTVKNLFPKQKVLDYQETPFGVLAVTQVHEQINIYENHIPVSSTENRVRAEESVHYTMLQRSSFKNVLLVSGGSGQVIQEIKKYSPRRIDYVELDPAMITLVKKYGLLKTSDDLNIINKDGQRHIKTTTEQYDAVLLNIP